MTDFAASGEAKNWSQPKIETSNIGGRRLPNPPGALAHCFSTSTGLTHCYRSGALHRATSLIPPLCHDDYRGSRMRAYARKHSKGCSAQMVFDPDVDMFTNLDVCGLSEARVRHHHDHQAPQLALACRVSRVIRCLIPVDGQCRHSGTISIRMALASTIASCLGAPLGLPPMVKMYRNSIFAFKKTPATKSVSRSRTATSYLGIG